MRALPPLFQGINDVDAYTALREIRERTAPAGEVLIAEGADSTDVICVVEGEVEISSRGVTLGYARSGDVVGEMALFGTGRRTASVTTTRPTQLMLLDRPGYERLRDVLHPLAVSLERRALRQQVDWLRACGDRIAELSDGAPRPASTSWFAAYVQSFFGRGGVFSVGVDPLEALRRNPLFAEASDEALAQIAVHVRPQAFGPGHVLCAEGEPGREMYLLDDGEVDVVVATEGDRVQALGTLRPGAAFGMVSLAQDRPRMSSCIAKTRVVVLTIDRTGWDRLVTDPYYAGTLFRRGMIRLLTEQLRSVNELISEYESRTERRALERAHGNIEAHGL
jgi:CRP/FNR family cyclic AMP-dependent transcriptional regulator